MITLRPRGCPPYPDQALIKREITGLSREADRLLDKLARLEEKCQNLNLHFIRTKTTSEPKDLTEVPDLSVDYDGGAPIVLMQELDRENPESDYDSIYDVFRQGDGVTYAIEASRPVDKGLFEDSTYSEGAELEIVESYATAQGNGNSIHDLGIELYGTSLADERDLPIQVSVDDEDDEDWDRCKIWRDNVEVEESSMSGQGAELESTTI